MIDNMPHSGTRRAIVRFFMACLIVNILGGAEARWGLNQPLMLMLVFGATNLFVQLYLLHSAFDATSDSHLRVRSGTIATAARALRVWCTIVTFFALFMLVAVFFWQNALGAQVIVLGLSTGINVLLLFWYLRAVAQSIGLAQLKTRTNWGIAGVLVTYACILADQFIDYPWGMSPRETEAPNLLVAAIGFSGFCVAVGTIGAWYRALSPATWLQMEPASKASMEQKKGPH